MAGPKVRRPGPWQTSDQDDWCIALMAVRDCEVLECRGEYRGSAKHVAMSARGGSFTVNGRNGCFLEGEFRDMVKG
eukprot:5773630-Pyramimonas_sp.AAC.1